jgi:hypothetical protein
MFSNMLINITIPNLGCLLLVVLLFVGCEDKRGQATPDELIYLADSAGDGATGEWEDETTSMNDGVCEPGERVCASAETYLECLEDGESRIMVQCEPGYGCLEGYCESIICEPFEIRDCLDDISLEVCNFSGTAWTSEACPEYWRCENGVCMEPPCIPGSTRCESLEVLLTCNPETGEYEILEQCSEGTACYEDECQPLCDINKKVLSYVGCEYWTVDLDNYGEAETIEHTVVLSNASADMAAYVAVEDAQGESMALDSAEVPAGGQLVIRFPSDRGLISAGISQDSWRITTTIPVTAHQFNPLDNFTDPFSNDGTLLLPTYALSNRYYAASWGHRSTTVAELNGFVSILSVEVDGIDITVTTPTHAAVGEGAEDMLPDESRSWTLAYGESLTLQTINAEEDLTGMLIEAGEGKIAVFGGHECANVVLGVDRCDHIETQLFPVELLGTVYLASKYAYRVTDEEAIPEPDYWRVLAVEGATFIQTDPEIPGIDGSVIASGEWLNIEYTEDFMLTADRPVLLAHYMVGSNWVNIPRECFDDTGPPTGIGDPSMTQVVPIEQFREDYLVLTPFAYVQDYLNLTVLTESVDSVIVDGEVVDPSWFEPVTDGIWSVARLPVEDGPHNVMADSPFGLDAYGYSCHVSYAYPGGMSLVGLEVEE